MKIKVEQAEYRYVMSLPRPKHVSPRRPGILFRLLMRLASVPDLCAVHFGYADHRPEALKRTPCLVLMNHSSFLDLEIASKILFPHPYSIVCTSDGFVGKEWLMRRLGCIPTKKFVTELSLIRDMKYALQEQRMSVLMYPEASYSFDGRTMTLPDSLGGLVKLLGVPVVMIRTEGAFARDPLYNGLRKRHVRVRATVDVLLDAEAVRTTGAEGINAAIRDAFALDYFEWQEKTGVTVTEPFRADGLERILYRCPLCGTEGRMKGQGTDISCHACGHVWHMDTVGRLQADDGRNPYPHIPDWYAWEREQVRAELTEGSYRLDVPVRIGMMVDYHAIYMVGTGRLVHDENGFQLTGCDGQLNYTQKPLSSYGLYADYYWYEIGDVICIGNQEALYYCFPQIEFPVAKARLAAEELYRMRKAGTRIAESAGRV